MTTDRRPAVRKLLWTKCLRGETGEKINGGQLPETELYNASGNTNLSTLSRPRENHASKLFLTNLLLRWKIKVQEPLELI
jgi:hypothetical protein